MKIIWIGNPFFSPCITGFGGEVHYIDYRPGEFFDWDSLRLHENITPQDIVVVADKSLPPAVLGVEKFPCLTVLYIVDSHIHSWFPFYAQAFDLCLVSLKDHLPALAEKRLSNEQCRWFPPCCLYPPISPDTCAEKKWDLLFVGTVDPAINPVRVDFLHRLKELFPAFHYCRGNFRELFPQAHLVLNHSIDQDLNFRVFEALGSGACLITPRIGHGQEDLFTPGEDLFVYDQNDLPALVELARSLLADKERCLAVARSGHEKVLRGHLGIHRAKELMDIITGWRETGKDQEFIQARIGRADEICNKFLRLVYLHLAETMPEYPELQKAYLAAARKSD